MRLRLNVTQLRILLLVANLAFATGVLGFAAHRYYYGVYDRKEDISLLERGSFAPNPASVGGPAKVSSDQLILSSVDWILQPKPAIDPTPPTPPEKKKEDETVSTDPSAYAPGPLDENWEYYNYIKSADPLDTLVQLRKKEAPVVAPGGAAGAPGSTRVTLRRTTVRPTRLNIPGKKGAAPATDHVSFWVRDRFVKRKDLELDFVADSADERRFVYWMREAGPKVKYALPMRVEDPVVEIDGTLFANMQPKVEGAAEEEAPADSKAEVKIRPADWEDRREDAYQRSIAGEKLDLSSFVEEQVVPAAAPSSSGPVPGPGTGSPARPGVTSPPSAEEVQKLRETIRKIPAKDREKLEKALGGTPRRGR